MLIIAINLLGNNSLINLKLWANSIEIRKKFLIGPIGGVQHTFRFHDRTVLRNQKTTVTA